MKRYLLFAWHTYGAVYPYGGWNDFKGDFDTLEDAKQFPIGDCDNAEIVDTEAMRVKSTFNQYAQNASDAWEDWKF